jgi:hypothetical protein
MSDKLTVKRGFQYMNKPKGAYNSESNIWLQLNIYNLIHLTTNNYQDDK